MAASFQLSLSLTWVCLLLWRAHPAFGDVYSFASEGSIRYTWGAAGVGNAPRGMANCVATQQLFVVGPASSTAIYKVNTTTNDNATFTASTLAGGSTGGTADGFGTSATLTVTTGSKGIILNDLCTHMYIPQGGATGSTAVGLLRRIRMNDSYVDTPLQIPSGEQFSALCIGIDQRTLYFYANGQVFYTDLQTWSTPQRIAGNSTTGFADGTGASARFRILSSMVEIEPGILLATDLDNNAIRHIVVATGTVTTIAGRPPPVAASGLADGVGTNARFTNPHSSAYYRPGQTLYITHLLTTLCLRKLHVPTGVVTTVICGATNVTTGPSAVLAGLSLDPPRSLAFLSILNNQPLPAQIWAVDIAFPTPTPRPASCGAGTACLVFGNGATVIVKDGGTISLG